MAHIAIACPEAAMRVRVLAVLQNREGGINDDLPSHYFRSRLVGNIGHETVARREIKAIGVYIRCIDVGVKALLTVLWSDRPYIPEVPIAAVDERRLDGSGTPR